MRMEVFGEVLKGWDRGRDRERDREIGGETPGVGAGRCLLKRHNQWLWLVTWRIQGLPLAPRELCQPRTMGIPPTPSSSPESPGCSHHSPQARLPTKRETSPWQLGPGEPVRPSRPGSTPSLAAGWLGGCRQVIWPQPPFLQLSRGRGPQPPGGCEHGKHPACRRDS